MLRNPFVSVAVGVVMIAISFLVTGTTRDTILRIVGALAIVVGVVMWISGRR